MRRETAGQAYAVVLVGGKGKRLRPLSTDSRPKAFLSVTRNRRTMFGNTLKRIAKVIPPGRIVVVANKAHYGLVKKDLPKASVKNLILEPSSRNTAPAIALAASILKNRNEDAVMLVLPTDHYVPEEDKQLAALRKGIDFVKNNGDAIVVVGIKPKHASTEFGYIRIIEPLRTKSRGALSAGIVKAEHFVEKPDLETAKKYIAGGRYLWNTGIFIFKVSALLKAIKKYAPKIFHGLKSKDMGRAYENMPDISIDYAILEKASNVYCVKGSYDWNDIGSFDALKKVLKRESRRFVEKDGKIIKIL